MQISIKPYQGHPIAFINSAQIELKDEQDAVDLLANCSYLGAERIIILEENITPAFFDLKTGVAGVVLQKFSTYRVKLSIVGDYTKYKSKSLHDFIYESNKGNVISFVGSVEEAQQKLVR